MLLQPAALHFQVLHRGAVAGTGYEPHFLRACQVSIGSVLGLGRADHILQRNTHGHGRTNATREVGPVEVAEGREDLVLHVGMRPQVAVDLVVGVGPSQSDGVGVTAQEGASRHPSGNVRSKSGRNQSQASTLALTVGEDPLPVHLRAALQEVHTAHAVADYPAVAIGGGALDPADEETGIAGVELLVAPQSTHRRPEGDGVPDDERHRQGQSARQSGGIVQGAEPRWRYPDSRVPYPVGEAHLPYRGGREAVPPPPPRAESPSATWKGLWPSPRRSSCWRSGASGRSCGMKERSNAGSGGCPE